MFCKSTFFYSPHQIEENLIHTIAVLQPSAINKYIKNEVALIFLIFIGIKQLQR